MIYQQLESKSDHNQFMHTCKYVYNLLLLVILILYDCYSSTIRKGDFYFSQCNISAQYFYFYSSFGYFSQHWKILHDKNALRIWNIIADVFRALILHTDHDLFIKYDVILPSEVVSGMWFTWGHHVIIWTIKF